MIGFWELEIESKKDIAQMLRDWIGRKCDKSMIFQNYLQLRSLHLPILYQKAVKECFVAKTVLNSFL